MTVSSTTSQSGPYLDTGVPTFAFDVQVLLPEDVQVVRTTKTGDLYADETLVEGSDYTLVLNGDQDNHPGGVVTLVANTPGTYITIVRNVMPVQSTSLPNQGGFYPEVIETAFDKLTLLVQQLLNITRRSVQVSVADPTPANDILNAIASASASAAANAVIAANAADSADADAATASGAAISADADATSAAGSANAAAQSAIDAASASRLTAGTVTTGAPGTDADVSITGAAGAQVVNFTLPRGDKGDKGEKGNAGPTGPASGGFTTNGPTDITLARTDGVLTGVAFTQEGLSGTIALSYTGGELTAVETKFAGRTRTETLHRTAGVLTSVTATEANS